MNFPVKLHLLLTLLVITPLLQANTFFRAIGYLTHAVLLHQTYTQSRSAYGLMRPEEERNALKKYTLHHFTDSTYTV